MRIVLARHLLALLAPPRCGVCGAPCGAGEPLCGRCARELATASPWLGTGPGLDLALAAASYEGAARRLAQALKYARRPALAENAAALIEKAAPATELRGVIVPVPAARLRGRWRGFDPAEEIAIALSVRTGLPLHACLRRLRGPRQVGRPRRRRLADPPRIELRRRPPRSVLLVDDVHTTGATLGACAAALRDGGAERVVALALARSRAREGVPAR